MTTKDSIVVEEIITDSERLLEESAMNQYAREMIKAGLDYDYWSDEDQVKEDSKDLESY